MTPNTPTLHMLCGKIAAGKSTLAHHLAQAENTVRLAEDDWLAALFEEELKTPQDYLRLSDRLRDIIGPHVVALLGEGLSVVLDYPANTVAQRRWMRGLLDQSGAAHRLHLLDPPDAVCLARLHRRNAGGDHPFAATEEAFHRFARHFQPPTPEEGFEILRYEQAQ